jgi:hypothetical protein
MTEVQDTTILDPQAATELTGRIMGEVRAKLNEHNLHPVPVLVCMFHALAETLLLNEFTLENIVNSLTSQAASMAPAIEAVRKLREQANNPRVIRP